MILVDTSVWIDHLRSKDPRLVKLLEDDLVLVHPWVKGELDLGLIKDREKFFKFLGYLTELRPVKDAEVLAFIESNSLAGRGIGWVDAGLLAAVRGQILQYLVSRQTSRRDRARNSASPRPLSRPISHGPRPASTLGCRLFQRRSE